MAARVAGALAAGGAERVALVGGPPRWAHALGLSHAPDRWPGEGPLGGLTTAVLDVPGTDPATTVVVVAACDQPWLDGDVVAELVAALVARPDAVAAVTVGPDGRRAPFPAAWRRGAGVGLAALVGSGRRRADDAFGLGPVVAVAVAPLTVADVDRPEDLPPPDRA